MISAVSAKGALLHDAAGPVYLVVDRHPAHRAAAVKQYLASTEGRLKLFFLPGCSPELNTDEMSLSQCELRRSSLAWLPCSLSFEVLVVLLSSVQRPGCGSRPAAGAARGGV
jgi:hypothetical protein